MTADSRATGEGAKVPDEMLERKNMTAAETRKSFGDAWPVALKIMNALEKADCVEGCTCEGDPVVVVAHEIQAAVGEALEEVARAGCGHCRCCCDACVSCGEGR